MPAFCAWDPQTHRDTETQTHRDTETQRHRHTGVLSKSMRPFSQCHPKGADLERGDWPARILAVSLFEPRTPFFEQTLLERDTAQQYQAPGTRTGTKHSHLKPYATLTERVFQVLQGHQKESRCSKSQPGSVFFGRDPFQVGLEGKQLAVCQNQWYHFGVGAPPISVYFSGDWDVHWGYDLDFDPWPTGNTNAHVGVRIPTLTQHPPKKYRADGASAGSASPPCPLPPRSRSQQAGRLDRDGPLPRGLEFLGKPN